MARTPLDHPQCGFRYALIFMLEALLRTKTAQTKGREIGPSIESFGLFDSAERSNEKNS
jgi:hypothetical protein